MTARASNLIPRLSKSLPIWGSKRLAGLPRGLKEMARCRVMCAAHWIKDELPYKKILLRIKSANDNNTESIQCAARITRHRAISLSPRGRPARRFDPQMGSDFESLGINFAARAVILGSWRPIFRISGMVVCFYRKRCLRGPPLLGYILDLFWCSGLTVFLVFCM